MTETQLLNLALGYLGEARVDTLTQNTNSAKHGAEKMRASVEQVLRVHRWNSATERQQLQRLTEENSFGPKYSYRLPTNYIALIEINGKEHDTEDDDRIEGSFLVTDEEEVEIVYVGYPSDFSVLDPALAETIAAKLAFNICRNVTGSDSDQPKMLELYERFLARAKVSDAKESSSRGKSAYALTMENMPMTRRRFRRR